MTPASLILAAPVSLATGILAQLLAARLLSSRQKGTLALVFALPALAAMLGAAPAVARLGALDVRLAPWDGPLQLVLRVDALSILFAAMGTGIGTAVLLYSMDYMSEERAATRFYALMLAFIGGLVGLVVSANLFLVYFFWELVGLCSFGLVGFWYQNPDAVRGARKVLLMTHLAGYGLLVAVLILHARTGSSLWTDPGVSQDFSSGVFLLMLVALVAKSVQFPLHTWIPEAMAAPTPVSALLHAACYVKAGVYLAARMHSFGPWQPSWGALMVGIGTATMLIGAAYAMVQSDLKRMLAFSTVSQIGYMITGLGIGTPLAVTAALLHCLNHGFFKGGLFLAAGAVQHGAGTRNMDELGGLAARMPRTAAVWMISAGCMMGVPLMSGFASKWMLYSAALQAGLFVPALAAWVASIGTVFYCAKATSVVFLGPATEKAESAHEAPASMQWGLFALAAGSIVLSVAPQLPVKLVLNPALSALGLRSDVGVTWFGLAGPLGAWWTTLGLILAVVSLGVGVFIFGLAGRSRASTAGGGTLLLGGGAFTGGEPLEGDGRLPASDFSEMFRHHFASFFRLVDVDRAYLAAFGALRAVAGLLDRAEMGAERHAIALIAALCTSFVGVAAWLLPANSSPAVNAAAGAPTVLVVGCALAGCALCVSALAKPEWRRLALIMAFVGAAAVAGLAAAQPILRLALLETSTALALLLVWRAAGSSASRWLYLAVALISAGALVGGELLLHEGARAAPWARALLIAGFFLKLGAAPLFLWLPKVAKDLPAVAMGLIVAVLDVAAFGELWIVAQQVPWLLEPRAVWLAVAAASALVGALLMLAERDVKRLLVLSTVEDLGFLLLGVTSGTSLGLSGAMTGAVAHALAKALLFASLSAPEADGALSAESAGLAASYPWSGAGFLIGMLGVLGVPPTLGFSARWRLYAVAAELGPWILGVFVLASAMALIAYALALARVFGGPSGAEGRAAREPKPLCAAIVGLSALLLLAGVWPFAIGILTGSAR